VICLTIMLLLIILANKISRILYGPFFREIIEK
jgi:hypothetical protein